MNGCLACVRTIACQVATLIRLFETSAGVVATAGYLLRALAGQWRTMAGWWRILAGVMRRVVCQMAVKWLLRFGCQPWSGRRTLACGAAPGMGASHECGMILCDQDYVATTGCGRLRRSNHIDFNRVSPFFSCKTISIASLCCCLALSMRLLSDSSCIHSPS